MAIKFSENVPIELRFPFGDFREVDGNYGTQFMYTVEAGSGPMDRLFASPELHRALQRAGVGPGSEFRITAARGDRRRRIWDIAPAVPDRAPVESTDSTQGRDTSAPADEPRPELRIEGPRAPSANGHGHRDQALGEGDEGASDDEWPSHSVNGDGRPPLPRELDQMGRLMGLCLHASARAWKRVIHGRQSPGDVRAVAITLFLECSRRGMTAEDVVQDLAA